MKRDHRDYINNILESINDTEDFVKGQSFEEFSKDKKTINAAVRSLEILGEAAKNIPNEIKKKYPKIPWKEMAGMRDKLIHEYHGVDHQIVWTVIKEELPPLKPKIRKIAGRTG